MLNSVISRNYKITFFFKSQVIGISCVDKKQLSASSSRNYHQIYLDTSHHSSVNSWNCRVNKQLKQFSTFNADDCALNHNEKQKAKISRKILAIENWQQSETMNYVRQRRFGI